MAARFEASLQCPVCRDIFREPVLLLCSHSFCLACLQQYWEHSPSPACPVCRTDSCVDRPPRNRALQELCEIFLQERSRAAETRRSCVLHGESLRLFCLEERRLLCGACASENTHLTHTCRPADEAAEALKEVLKTRLKPFQEKRKRLQSEKFTCHQRVKYIRNQAAQTEAQITAQMEDLRAFLRDEEALRIAALRDEEERRTQALEETIRRINTQLSTLSDTIRDAEEELEDDNISFLMKHKGPPEGLQSFSPSPEELPEEFPEELIDVAKHLGNLKFRIWQKMKSSAPYIPVVLDPVSAHPCVRVSSDLSALRLGPWVRGAPGRDGLRGCTSALGSEALGRGTHRWDVEVGDSSTWAVGVISQSAVGSRDNPPESSLWRLGLLNGTYGQGQGEVLTPLKLTHPLRVLRVLLDWDEGTLSFIDPLTDTHLHTFSQRFSETLVPYFCNVCPDGALRVLPLESRRDPTETFSPTRDALNDCQSP